MSYRGKNMRSIAFEAAEDLVAYRLVYLSTGTAAAKKVSYADNATNPILGVTVDAADSGANVAVVTQADEFLVEASAAIAVNAQITATTDGKAVTSSTATDNIAGIAVEAASADGDKIRCRIAPVRQNAG